MDLYEVNVDYVEYLRKVEPKKIISNSGDKLDIREEEEIEPVADITVTDIE